MYSIYRETIILQTIYTSGGRGGSTTRSQAVIVSAGSIIGKGMARGCRQPFLPFVTLATPNPLSFVEKRDAFNQAGKPLWK
jgi:hypothetical protein